MKTLYIQFVIIIGAIFSTHTTTAQLIADAGKDKYRCESDSIQIGGSPTADFGTPPYTYYWEASHPMFGNIYPASTFLDDIFSANPKVANPSSNNNDEITFKLTVTDALNNTAVDSMVVTCSSFASLLVDLQDYINAGDSVNLWCETMGGIPPVTYQWSPSYALSDATSPTPWAKPDTTTFYQSTITDVAGCQGFGQYKVFVNPVGVNSHQNQAILKLYPNPSTNSLTIENLGQQKAVTIEIRNVTGQVVYVQKEANFSKTTVNTSNIPVGVYWVNIKAGQQNLATQKWVKVE